MASDCNDWDAVAASAVAAVAVAVTALLVAAVAADADADANADVATAAAEKSLKGASRGQNSSGAAEPNTWAYIARVDW